MGRTFINMIEGFLLRFMRPDAIIEPDVVIDVIPGVRNELLPWIAGAIVLVIVITVIILVRMKKKKKEE